MPGIRFINEMPINSPENPKVKQIKKCLSNKKYRKENQLYLVESHRHLNDLLINTPHSIQFILYTKLTTEIKDKANQHNIALCLVSETILKQCTHVKQSSGAVALVKYISPQNKKAPNNAFFLNEIQNPRNLGAVIRNAVAFGLTTLYLSPNSVDMFHPEVIRAAAGAINQIRIKEITLSTLLKEQKTLSPIVLDSNAKLAITQAQLPEKCLFIFGSESGFKESLNEQNNYQTYFIPLENNLDSLNLAVTTGIIGFYLSLR